MLFSQRLEEITRETSGPDGIAALVVTALATEESYYIAWKTLGGDYKQDGQGLPALLQEWLFPEDGSTRDLASLQVVIGRDGEFWASDVKGKIEGSAAPAVPAPPQRLTRAMTFPNKRRSVVFNAGDLGDIPGSPGEHKRSSSTASPRTAAPPAPGIKRAPTAGFISSIFGRGAAPKVEPVVTQEPEEKRSSSPAADPSPPVSTEEVPASPPKRGRPIALRMGSTTKFDLPEPPKPSDAAPIDTTQNPEEEGPPPPPKQSAPPPQQLPPKDTPLARTQPQLDPPKPEPASTTTAPPRFGGAPLNHRRGTSSISKARLSALNEDTSPASTPKANAKIPRLPLVLNPITRTNTMPATTSPEVARRNRSRTIADIHPLPDKTGFAEPPPAKRRCTCGYVDSIRVTEKGVQASLLPEAAPLAPPPAPALNMGSRSRYVDSGMQTDPPPPPAEGTNASRGIMQRDSFASSMPPSVFDTMSNRTSAATADTEVYYYYVDDDGYVDDAQYGGPGMGNPFPMGRMTDYFRSGGYSLGDALG